MATSAGSLPISKCIVTVKAKVRPCWSKVPLQQSLWKWTTSKGSKHNNLDMSRTRSENRKETKRRTTLMASKGRDIIVIGTSAGGLEALDALIGQLPTDLPASIFIAQHMAPENTGEAL